MNGKGSKQRPLSVPYEKYSDNFDNIFNKKYTVKVQKLSDGDQFIELPDELVGKLGWCEGDQIEWHNHKNGYHAKKKEL